MPPETLTQIQMFVPPQRFRQSALRQQHRNEAAAGIGRIAEQHRAPIPTPPATDTTPAPAPSPTPAQWPPANPPYANAPPAAGRVACRASCGSGKRQMKRTVLPTRLQLIAKST